MSFDLPADPDAEPSPAETSTLLIYLRGGQTIEHVVADLSETSLYRELRKMDWEKHEDTRVPCIRLDAIDAVVVMPTVVVMPAAQP